MSLSALFLLAQLVELRPSSQCSVTTQEAVSVRHNDPRFFYFANALRVVPLSPSEILVIYRDPTPAEPSGMSAAYIAGDEISEIRTSQLVPEDEIAPDTHGQIYAGARVGAHVVLALGWRFPGRGGSNAIAVLQRRERGWSLVRLIRGMGSVSDLAAIGESVFVAPTALPSRRSTAGIPLLSFIDLSGRVVGEAIQIKGGDWSKEISDARTLARVTAQGDRLAVTDASRNIVVKMKVRIPAATQTQTGDVTAALTFPAGLTVATTEIDQMAFDQMSFDQASHQAAATIASTFLTSQGDLGLIVQKNIGGRVTTEVDIRGSAKQCSWSTTEYLQAPYWQNGKLYGIAHGATPTDPWELRSFAIVLSAPDTQTRISNEVNGDLGKEKQ